MELPEKTDRTEQLEVCKRFAGDLDVYVRSRYKYKSNAVSVGFAHTVEVRRSTIELYLRFKPRASWPNDSIVIARIGFAKQRKGNGTSLLRFLVDAAPQYGIQSIGIEQAIGGEEIDGFVRKFGFTQYRNEESWIVSLKDLKKSLDELTEQ